MAIVIPREQKYYLYLCCIIYLYNIKKRFLNNFKNAIILLMKGGYFGAANKFHKSTKAFKQAFNKHSNTYSTKQSTGNGI